MLYKNNLIVYFVASFRSYGAWHVLFNFSRIVLTYIARFPEKNPISFFKKEIHQLINGIIRKNISAEIMEFKRRTILHRHNPHANASRMLFLFC